jgi:hypothetical protein
MSKENKKLDSVAKVLQGLFENSKSPLSEGFQRYRLEQEWPKVVGATLGQCTRPVDCQEGLLTIAVTNPSLLTELQFFRQEIITKINTHVGKLWVHKVRFVSE